MLTEHLIIFEIERILRELTYLAVINICIITRYVYVSIYCKIFVECPRYVFVQFGTDSPSNDNLGLNQFSHNGAVHKVFLLLLY